ncbi:MAG: helix-turn-helix domain-containing protein [Anaerolineae bacterium]
MNGTIPTSRRVLLANLTSRMTYSRHIPSPPLNAYIDHFYYLDGQMPFRHEKILPVPALDLKINLGSAFHMYEKDSISQPISLTKSWLVGLYGVHHSIDWPSDMQLYGIRFKPAGAYPFAGFPLSEVYNQVITLDTIWGQWASEIRERLHAAPTIEAGLVLFERLLRDRLYETQHGQNIVEYAISLMAQNHGMLSIRALSDCIGISQNHLGTLFKRIVGTSAKQLARLYRFEHTLHSIERTHVNDWTQIASQSGYYDLSHLNKDFVTFTGHSPMDYLPLRRRVYVEDALVDQLSLRNLPTD